MRKILYILLVLLLILGYSTTVNNVPVVRDGTHLLIPLEGSGGQVCKPYTPQGDFIYDSQWTGEYPQIEVFDRDFATATFGMG